MTTPIGFIGQGIMGSPMALNLLKAGYPVTVYNRDKDKNAPAAKAGAKVADTPASLAAGSDVVILMLTGPEAIQAVLEGPDGALAAMEPGKTVVNMSSVEPVYTRELNERLAAKGIIFIDAPVSGSKKPAEDGGLIILAGGDKKTVDALEPVFLTMGKKVIFCGEAGHGSAMKMAVNLLLSIMMTGFGEVLAMGRASGLAEEAMLDAFLSGAMSCPLFNGKAGMIRTGDYPPQFPLKHMHKDLGFILNTAQEAGADIPLGRAVLEQYGKAMTQELGEADFAAVVKVSGS
jgi:3-hydroxyisobutyrate dehydrogenase-like beta-hydroxyacid dehydrogenase